MRQNWDGTYINTNTDTKNSNTTKNEVATSYRCTKNSTNTEMQKECTNTEIQRKTNTEIQI